MRQAVYFKIVGEAALILLIANATVSLALLFSNAFTLDEAARHTGIPSIDKWNELGEEGALACANYVTRIVDEMFGLKIQIQRHLFNSISVAIGNVASVVLPLFHIDRLSGNLVRLSALWIFAGMQLLFAMFLATGDLFSALHLLVLWVGTMCLIPARVLYLSIFEPQTLANNLNISPTNVKSYGRFAAMTLTFIPTASIFLLFTHSFS